MAKKKIKYEIIVFKDINNRYRWRIISAINGKIMATSEAYSRKGKATQTVFAFLDALTKGGVGVLLNGKK